MVPDHRHAGSAVHEDVVDAHVHVWDPDLLVYPWLSEVPQLERRFDIEHVADDLAEIGIGQVVLVQAADEPTDTELMLTTARRNAAVAGVVGWIPLLDAATAERLLDRWSGEPIVGVRHLAHRDPDRDLLARPEVDDALALLAERNLTFDVCAETEHLLALVPSMAERHPTLTLVVDHLAKPPIRQRGWEPWASLIRAAAEAPNVTVKLSGLNTAAAPGDDARALAPYVDHALDCFGPTRTMYGGDWPFALLAADSYGEIWHGLRPCLDGLAEAERLAVLAETARRVYRLPRPSDG